MNERVKKLAEQAVEETQLLMLMEYKNFESEIYKRFAELVIKDALQLITYIANDYVELSNDKVQWQRNDYIKRCREFLKAYHTDES